MLSSKSATAPALNLKPSRLLAIYTVSGHALALVALFYPMSIPISARLMIAIAVIASFIYHWRTREPVVALRAPLKDGLWLLELKDGRQVSAELRGEYTVTTWLMALRFRITDEKRKLTVVVLPDSGDKEAIRGMRVFLRQLAPH